MDEGAGGAILSGHLAAGVDDAELLQVVRELQLLGGEQTVHGVPAGDVVVEARDHVAGGGVHRREAGAGRLLTLVYRPPA